MLGSISENLSDIRGRISAAAKRSARAADEIKLVAVSKTHPAETLREAMAAGVSVFGENKVQEAEGKIAEIGRTDAEWHLIGHLQSVDLAQRLERICGEEGRDSLSVLVQVDIAREATKAGIPEPELPELIETLGG